MGPGTTVLLENRKLGLHAPAVSLCKLYSVSVACRSEARRKMIDDAKARQGLMTMHMCNTLLCPSSGCFVIMGPSTYNNLQYQLINENTCWSCRPRRGTRKGHSIATHM